MPEDLFADLFAYQTMLIRKPFDCAQETTFRYDLPAYFENIYTGNAGPLRKRNTRFRILPKKQYTDWETYAKETVWYGRRKEANIYHRDEYRSEPLDTSGKTT